MLVTLTPAEQEILARQDPSSRNHGGWQNFLVGLQEHVDPDTGQIELTQIDIERIARYGFDYGQGGWEDRLVGAFGRVLGTSLGR